MSQRERERGVGVRQWKRESVVVDRRRRRRWQQGREKAVEPTSARE